MKTLIIALLIFNSQLNKKDCESKIIEFRLRTFDSSFEELKSDFLPDYPDDSEFKDLIEDKIKELKSLNSENLSILSYETFIRKFPEKQNDFLPMNTKNIYVLTDNCTFIPYRITDSCELLLFRLKTGKYTYFF